MTTRPVAPLGGPHRTLGLAGDPPPSRRLGPPAPATTAAKPVVPITSFFSRDEVLVWPSDAPAGGDLGMKRTTSDKASLAVLREYNRQGLARSRP